jgi:hypothetical protein
MQACQLAELAGWVAIQSPQLNLGSEHHPLLLASSYWSASRTRVQRWISALKQFELELISASTHVAGSAAPAGPAEPNWPAMETVLEEIILSDLLTRVWSATVTANNQPQRAAELQSLADSVFISQLETKNRAFRLLLASRELNEDFYHSFNRLRRRMERWCDLFLGQIPLNAQALLYSYDSNRVRDFYSERCLSPVSELLKRQRLLTHSFFADLPRQRKDSLANPDLNRQIAEGILACFPADRFEPQGLPEAIRPLWLEKSQADTQMLLDHLIDFEIQVSQS